MCTTRSQPSQITGGGAPRALALAAFAWLACSGTAQAETTTFDGLDAPIVRINVHDEDVTIRTWNRAAVALDAAPGLVVQRRVVHLPVAQIPLFIPSARAGRGDGEPELPAESFVVSSIPYGPREQIVIKSPPALADGRAPAAPITVTVPADAVFISARTGGGNLEVHDYRAGTFVGFSGRGRLALFGSGGTAFVQTGHGALSASDSSFDRLRARSLSGDMTFERCRVRQIEATSVNGSLVYDGGSFDPGLARFESTRGNVALGTLGPVQIAAHAAGTGKVFTDFEHGARVEGNDGTATASVAGGGPIVNVTTQAGNVFLYDGALRKRSHQLPAVWLAPLDTLQHPGAGALHRNGPGRSAFPRPRPGERPTAVRGKAVPSRPRERGRDGPSPVRFLQRPERRAVGREVEIGERHLR